MKVTYKCLPDSGVARAFPCGRLAHPEDQIEEENEEKLRKMGENNRRMRKNEEMFLSCPPEVGSLGYAPATWERT